MFSGDVDYHLQFTLSLRAHTLCAAHCPPCNVVMEWNGRGVIGYNDIEQLRDFCTVVAGDGFTGDGLQATHQGK